MKAGETPEQAIIKLYFQEKLTPRKVRNKIGCGQERVTNAIEYYKKYHQIPAPKKIGRPTKATNLVMEEIIEMTTKNRMISGFQISKDLKTQYNIEISPKTANNYRKKLNYNYQLPKIRQALSENQIKLRYLFSNSVLGNNIDLNRIVFSDECRFCLTNDGLMRWYRKGEDTSDTYDEKEKYNTGIMVYGAIGLNYKSDLVICEDSINEIGYRRLIIESNMIDVLNVIYEPGSYFFMQDGAPAHKSFLTSIFLKKRCSYIQFWPPNSPNLNPIEHL